jgi:hypothetical protein
VTRDEIVKQAVERANGRREQDAVCAAESIIESIAEHQQAIGKHQADIAKLQKQLTELAVETVQLP